MMKKNDVLHGMFFLILAQTMVGLNIVASKYILSSIPVLIILMIRFTCAGFILLPLHWLTPARQYRVKDYFLKLKGRDWIFIGAQALSAGILFNCLMLTGLHYTDANVAGIITSVLPAIIALLSWIILGEKISAQKIICILIATTGLIVIAYDQLKEIGASHSFFGDFIVLLSLLPEAAYYILSKLYTNKLPVFLTSALLNLINAILLLPVVLYLHWDPSSVTTQNWFILLIISLSSGLFYVFWFMGAQRVDGVLASLSTAVMPVATVILAWMILHEALTPLQLTGMGLVILSVIFYTRR